MMDNKNPRLVNGYVYLPVSDFDTAAKWYEEMFGFATVFTDPLYRELRSASGIRLMLINNHSRVHSHMMYDNTPQAAYGFTVNDIDSIRAYLLSKDVNVKEPVGYQGKSCSFTDPDGNVIELWEEQKRSCDL